MPARCGQKKEVKKCVPNNKGLVIIPFLIRNVGPQQIGILRTGGIRKFHSLPALSESQANSLTSRLHAACSWVLSCRQFRKGLIGIAEASHHRVALQGDNYNK